MTTNVAEANRTEVIGVDGYLRLAISGVGHLRMGLGLINGFIAGERIVPHRGVYRGEMPQSKTVVSRVLNRCAGVEVAVRRGPCLEDEPDFFSGLSQSDFCDRVDVVERWVGFSDSGDGVSGSVVLAGSISKVDGDGRDGSLFTGSGVELFPGYDVMVDNRVNRPADWRIVCRLGTMTVDRDKGAAGDTLEKLMLNLSCESYSLLCIRGLKSQIFGNCGVETVDGASTGLFSDRDHYEVCGLQEFPLEDECLQMMMPNYECVSEAGVRYYFINRLGEVGTAFEERLRCGVGVPGYTRDSEALGGSGHGYGFYCRALDDREALYKGCHCMSGFSTICVDRSLVQLVRTRYWYGRPPVTWFEWSFEFADYVYDTDGYVTEDCKCYRIYFPGRDLLEYDLKNCAGIDSLTYCMVCFKELIVRGKIRRIYGCKNELH